LERFLTRKSLLALGVPELRTTELDQVLGIALIHDAEVARHAGGSTEPSKQSMRGCVKRPAIHAATCATYQPLRSGEHFLCGATCKRQEEDSLRSDAFFDQVGEAVDQRAGLSSPCARDDEQWTVAERCSDRLFGVELRREIAPSAADCLRPLGVGAAFVDPHVRHGAQYTRRHVSCRCFFGASSVHRTLPDTGMRDEAGAVDLPVDERPVDGAIRYRG